MGHFAQVLLHCTQLQAGESYTVEASGLVTPYHAMTLRRRLRTALKWHDPKYRYTISETIPLVVMCMGEQGTQPGRPTTPGRYDWIDPLEVGQKHWFRYDREQETVEAYKERIAMLKRHSRAFARMKGRAYKWDLYGNEKIGHGYACYRVR